jgi:hypothetical protein
VRVKIISVEIVLEILLERQEWISTSNLPDSIRDFRLCSFFYSSRSVFFARSILLFSKLFSFFWKMSDTEDTLDVKSSVANCRMYEQKYPKVDDLVMVEVKSIEEMGAYVALKEYNDIEGMILLSELSRRRIRSINKIIRVGRLEVVVVLRVDEDKGTFQRSKERDEI